MDSDPGSMKPAWHATPIDEALAAFNTSEEGLSDDEAHRRLEADGANELPSTPPKSIAQMLKDQLLDPMILILIGAAALSAALSEWVEASVIALIVVANATISIVQEKKAATALEALRQMSAPTARVIREDEESVIPAREIVPGDIVVLSDGDMVPADLRLIDSAQLECQEASLTGESLPAEKDADDMLPEACALGDRSTMAYSSTVVTRGRALGIAVATGGATEVGAIAHMMEDADKLDTPLKRKLAAVGKVLTVIGIVVCAAILVIGLIYQRPFVPQLLIAISLAISIIPEGLPATATIVMALGVQRMAREQALIRNLPAVETLGSATVICSDKTGTLTQNRMTVTHVALECDLPDRAIPIGRASQRDGSTFDLLVRAAALCNDASFDPDRPGAIIGDPTEGALLTLASGHGVDHELLEDEFPRAFEQPFDSERKRMTTVHLIEGRPVAFTKGAVDELLPLCTGIMTERGVRPLEEADVCNTLARALELSDGALRVLGFATRELAVVPEDEDADVERDLTFIGLVGMIDPPREEVADSVRACREAGIRTVMITGDHRATAIAIARSLDIYRDGDQVITGDELDAMDEAELDARVGRATVFARVSPEHKLAIVRALKRRGEVVAMTGDGVNDAPALSNADIGVAMGIAGTDVAKQAADMVLLDDRFTTIEQAIREGRRVYRNIQKVIQFLLAGNIAEITTLLVAVLFNWDAPLTGVHILWVNLATATLPALALGVDPAGVNDMKHPPRRGDTLFEAGLVQRVATQGVFVALCTLAAYQLGASGLIGVGGHVVGQTMAFCVLAFSQMMRAFEQRSNTLPIWRTGVTANPWLLVSFAMSAALVLAMLCVPAFGSWLGVVPLGAIEWLAVLGLAGLSIVQIELAKVLARG